MSRSRDTNTNALTDDHGLSSSSLILLLYPFDSRLVPIRSGRGERVRGTCSWEQTWGKPAYDLEIISDDGQPVLHLRSKGETSAIIRDLKASVDLKETPIIEWRWKVMTLPTGGNACQKSTDDEAAQVYVAWLRSPEAVRSRIIGYVWDSTAPAGTICKSEKTSTVTYVVLRSGADELGKWITERRNVVEDFHKIYGEAPNNPNALSLGIDSDDTRSSAESFIGPIVFTRP